MSEIITKKVVKKTAREWAEEIFDRFTNEEWVRFFGRDTCINYLTGIMEFIANPSETPRQKQERCPHTRRNGHGDCLDCLRPKGLITGEPAVPNTGAGRG